MLVNEEDEEGAEALLQVEVADNADKGNNERVDEPPK